MMDLKAEPPSVTGQNLMFFTWLRESDAKDLRSVACKTKPAMYTATDGSLKNFRVIDTKKKGKCK
jgi:hypothetical protein